MKAIPGSLLSASFVIAAFAGPNETTIIAAMKLSEAANYTWRTSVLDGSGETVIDGKTEVGGVTWSRQPLPRGLGRQFDRQAGSELELLSADGSGRVVRVGEQWKNLADVSAAHARDQRPQPHVRGRLTGRMGTLGAPMPAPNVSLLSRHDDFGYASARGLDLGVSLPHEELGILVSCHSVLESDGRVATGELSALGAQLLLVRDETDVSTLAAKGTFKLWLNADRIVRYQLRLEGTLLVGARKVEVRRTTDTSVRDVGTTRLDLPAEARRKVGR